VSHKGSPGSRVGKLGSPFWQRWVSPWEKFMVLFSSLPQYIADSALMYNDPLGEKTTFLWKVKNWFIFWLNVILKTLQNVLENVCMLKRCSPEGHPCRYPFSVYCWLLVSPVFIYYPLGTFSWTPGNAVIWSPYSDSFNGLWLCLLSWLLDVQMLRKQVLFQVLMLMYPSSCSAWSSAVKQRTGTI
jgi:hypothetical protein